MSFSFFFLFVFFLFLFFFQPYLHKSTVLNQTIPKMKSTVKSRGIMLQIVHTLKNPSCFSRKLCLHRIIIQSKYPIPKIKTLRHKSKLTEQRSSREGREQQPAGGRRSRSCPLEWPVGGGTGRRGRMGRGGGLLPAVGGRAPAHRGCWSRPGAAGRQRRGGRSRRTLRRPTRPAGWGGAAAAVAVRLTAARREKSRSPVTASPRVDLSPSQRPRAWEGRKGARSREKWAKFDGPRRCEE
jgi:hypothetical protein